MSTRPPTPNDSTGPLDHLSLRYLRQSLDTSHPTDEPYVLNAVESRVIRRTKISTLIMACLLGVVGILLLYGPQYMWPNLFSSTPVRLFGDVYNVSLITIIYGILLVYIEVNLLVALNLRGVKSIMRVCNFPNAHDAQYERHLQSMANAVLKKSGRGVLHIGIDPYLTMPRWGLTIFFLLNMVKAALTNLTLTSLLRQFLARYVVRQVIDLIAMPVYAFWNAWASWQVLHEAQIRVMAPTTIREFVHELHEEWGKNDQFRPLILEALQFMAVLNRQSNYAHSLLTETLIDRFELQTDSLPDVNFPEHAVQAPIGIRQSLERLIVFGVLIDGKVSRLEKRRLRALRQKGLLTHSAHEINRIGNDYNRGHGLWV